MLEELRQAIEELEARQRLYELADEKYEAVAYHEREAARERVNAIIKESKGG